MPPLQENAHDLQVHVWQEYVWELPTPWFERDVEENLLHTLRTEAAAER